MFEKDAENSRPLPMDFFSTKSNEKSNHSPEWIHSTKNNNWKNWYCSVGMKSLYIDFDGNVFVGTCSVGGWYGNIFREGLSPDKNLLEWIKCTASSCQCGADMFAPKVREKNLIPKNVEDLFRAYRDKSISEVQQVKSPDVVMSRFIEGRKMIVWDIGRRCNYSCSYCSPGSHNNYEAHKSLGSLKHAVDLLYQVWMCDYPGKFIITGGEPTIHPQYLEFVRYIKESRAKNTVHTTTNGSRDAKFYSELMLMTDMTFSGHTESLSLPRTYDRFVENIGACVQARKSCDPAQRNGLSVRLMLKPGQLELVQCLYEDIKKLPDFENHATIHCDLLHETSLKADLIPYSDTEKVFVRDHS